MRNSLAVATAFLFVILVGGAAACGGGTTSKGTSSGNGATGTGTGGSETTTGGSSTGGGLPAGATCSSDSSCKSGHCGVGDGGGNCCSSDTGCSTDPTCGASACDDTGACVYPSGGTCAPSTCSDAMLVDRQCNGFGTCFILPAQACPDNFACNNAGACNTTCSATGDCASGSYCSDGGCVPKATNGACSENDACVSGVCGLDGSGDCCASVCSTSDPLCGATGCDATSGACLYPGGTTFCGSNNPESCTGNIETDPNVFCDGAGNCPSQQHDCTPFVCGPSSCLTSCSDDNSCVSSAYCSGGLCTNKIAAGACIQDDACVSNLCGLSGTGNCCNVACSTADATCGAPGCDPSSGACLYPGTSTACGTVMESCTGNTQQDPSVCDGQGNCPIPGTTNCTPFLCGTNSCLASCADNTSCVGGDFCDTGTSTCCAALSSGQIIDVDGIIGSDATACCGYSGANPCKTIAHVMKLIDDARAANVTIVATLSGIGGDWPASETYPIVLGWGIELSAPGIFFVDRNPGSRAEIFDIAPYSTNDTIGYASIFGTAASPVGIGMDAALTNQSADTSAVTVENGQTLYIANAMVNSSALNASNALNVAAGATLMLGEDQLKANFGTVNIGNSSNVFGTDGWDGIVCGSANNQGCTVMDTVIAGASSVVIQGQEDLDIWAQDFSVISLTGSPIIGVAPGKAGFNQCPASNAITSNSPAGKPDVSSGKGQAIWLEGKANVTFTNGTVQCISGAGFHLQTSPSGNGDPTLTLSNTTVQNTERAVYAEAGTATIANSLIQYNYNGVEQATTGTIDLSGGNDAGTNVVICSDGKESINAPTTPGVSVLNASAATLNADDVAWDTTGPDLFSCTANLKTCTCEISGCTNAGGVDEMDAVYDSTGTITTSGNTQSKAAVAAKCN